MIYQIDLTMIIERVNIGLVIEQKINELGLSKSEFGRKIGVPQQNVNRILDKPNIDTDKLVTISEALGYNFFKEYSNDRNNAIASGDGAVAVNGNNNSNVVAGNGTDAILAERVKHLEEMLVEKERLIKVYEKMMEK